MVSLMQVLAQTLQSATDYEEWRDIIRKILEIEGDSDKVNRIALGLEGTRIEFTPDSMTFFTANGTQTSLSEISAIAQSIDLLLYENGLNQRTLATIDDTVTAAASTWSSTKIAASIAAVPMISFGTTAPVSPTDGQLWVEPNAQFPQPWTWDNTSGLWLSAPMVIDFGATTATFASGSGTGLNRSVPYYATSSNRIKLLAIRGMYSTDSATNSSSTAAHTSTDYYTSKLRKFRGTDSALVDFYTFSATSAGMSTSGSTAYRRFTETFTNTWLEGNVFVINWYLTRNGSATGSFSINTNIQVYFQSARGAS